jgi:hypothetical protein
VAPRPTCPAQPAELMGKDGISWEGMVVKGATQ